MPELFFISSVLNDTMNYAADPLNRGEIIFQLILLLLGLILTGVLTVVYKPVHEFIINVRKWWIMSRNNPDLDMEVILNGNINPQAPEDFTRKMRNILNNALNISLISFSKESFQFPKIFGTFEGNFKITPGIDNHSEDNYDHLYINFRTKNIRLKDLKKGLADIQLYIFRDLSSSINQEIKFNPNVNNEGVEIAFNTFPMMLQGVKDLNISSLDAEDSGIRIRLTIDKISFNGNIESQSIDKIEYLIRSNLAT